MKRILLTCGTLVVCLILYNVLSSANPLESAYEPIIITGKIIALEQNSFTVDVLTGLHVEKAVVLMNKKTLFGDNVNREMKINNIVVFQITDSIMESDPVQVIAKLIIANDPPQK